MNMMKCMLAALALSGCTWVGTREQVKAFPDSAAPVDMAQSFYLVYPKDGKELGMWSGELSDSEGSAAAVAKVFENEFYKHMGSLNVSDGNVSVEAGLKDARARGDKYLVAMDIHEWKDAFYMTCRPNKRGDGALETLDSALDSVDITMSVYDVSSGRLVNKQRLQNSGCPMVFLGVIPVGKNGPESRFREMLGKWYANLGEAK